MRHQRIRTSLSEVLTFSCRHRKRTRTVRDDQKATEHQISIDQKRVFSKGGSGRPDKLDFVAYRESVVVQQYGKAHSCR